VYPFRDEDRRHNNRGRLTNEIAPSSHKDSRVHRKATKIQCVRSSQALNSSA
jgi:hypothetical protein